MVGFGFLANDVRGDLRCVCVCIVATVLNSYSL